MGNEAAREACSFFLGRLQSEAFRLRDIAFPGRDPGPQLWLNLVDGVLETAQDYLKKVSNRNSPPSSVSGLIEDAETLGEFAYQALQHVAGVDATQIPEQMIAPFQRWVTRLQISQTIFFRAEHLPNYELGTFDYRRLANINLPSKGLQKAIGAINWPALRVTVPAQAMGMLPHFAVVGHELGHAIQDRIKLDPSPHQQALNQTHQQITNRLAPHNIPFGSAEILRAQGIVDNWTNELKADAVGYNLVGPAFFFALFGFLELAGRSYGISPTHPPSDLRRDVLFRQLSTGNPSFRDVFDSGAGMPIGQDTNSPHLPTCPDSNKLFLELMSEFKIVDAAICVELVPYARQIADTVYAETKSYLRQLSPDLIYEAENLKHDLSIHLKPLCELIPPIEFFDTKTVRATSLASILNVGWAALLTRVREIPPVASPLGDETARKMERLHDLLLKAVELSEARHLWEEHK